MARVIKMQVVKSQEARAGDPQLELPKAVKARLMPLVFAEERPAPEAPGDAQKTPITLWLSDEEEARVKALAEAEGISSLGVYLTRLLYAALRDPADTRRHPIDIVTDALGKASRPAQREFATQISAHLFNAPIHSVLLAEAATGIGKSLGFLSVALDALQREPDRPVIIAAPSYAVLRQSFSDWCAMAEAIPNLPAAAFVMGQQEFVDERALRALVEDREDPDAQAWTACAALWMAAGAPPPPDSGVTQTWTQAGLRAACPEFPHSETVRLTSDAGDSDAGRVAYRAQVTACDADGNALPHRVVFATHAMLAIEVKLRRMAAQRAFRDTHGITAGAVAWSDVEERRAGAAALEDGSSVLLQAYAVQNDLLRVLNEEEGPVYGRLPSDALVIIDEAHLLEEAFARTFASGESVWRLFSAAKTLAESSALSEQKRTALRAALSRLQQARDHLRTLGAESGGASDRVVTRSPNPDAGDDQVIEALRTLQTALLPFAGKLAQFKRGADDMEGQRAKTRIARALEALSLGLRDDAAQIGVGMRISWSPTLAWPSFEAGQMNVTAQLDYLWQAVAHRGICVSATLLTHTGIDPAGAIQRILGIRPRSGVLLPPIHPTWVTLPVEVRLPPSPDARPHPEWLAYPRRDATGAPPAGALHIWVNEVADYISSVVIDNTRDRRGGILVLLTSHADRVAITQALALRLAPSAILTQEPGRPLDALKAAFIERRRQGIIPVLIGVGSCWTGLDLSEASSADSPCADTLLTDLVIGRLPIGTNRTLTHLERKRRRGYEAEVLSTAVTLRQGVGRLVRRQGVTGRVLHVIDGRLDRKDKAWPQLRTLTERILSVYPNRTHLKPSEFWSP